RLFIKGRYGVRGEVEVHAKCSDGSLFVLRFQRLEYLCVLGDYLCEANRVRESVVTDQPHKRSQLTEKASQKRHVCAPRDCEVKVVIEIKEAVDVLNAQSLLLQHREPKLIERFLVHRPAGFSHSDFFEHKAKAEHLVSSLC